MRMVPAREAARVRPPDNDTVIESQRQALRGTFDPDQDKGVPIDIRENMRILQMPTRNGVAQQRRNRTIVRPGGIAMTDWGTSIEGNIWTLVIPKRDERKRFVIINPNPANMMFWGVTAKPITQVPVFQNNGVWDESGSEITTDNIFVLVVGAGLFPVGALEGVPLEIRRDELKQW